MIQDLSVCIIYLFLVYCGIYTLFKNENTSLFEEVKAYF